MASLIAARRYDIEELLNMRSSLSTIIFRIKEIDNLSDLACVLRLHPKALQSPETFTCKSRELPEIQNHIRVVQQPTRSRITDSSEEAELHTGHMPYQNHESHQVQWKLRRTDSSDRSSQPHSAPSGIAAQRSENFQRFYRAVVSPTHVRVTAGGRIVPNTRALPPPQFNWNSEKFHFEPRDSNEFDIAPVEHSNWVPENQMNMAYPPGANIGIPPQLPHPLMPLHPQPLEIKSNEQQESRASGEALNGVAPRIPIKISPPTQFDQTKPFIFNGHVVYPVPPGFQPPPSAITTVLGNPNLLSPSPLAPQPGFPSPQFPIPVSTMPSPIVFPGHQFPMMMPSPIQPSEGMIGMSPFMQMPSTELRKEFLKSQIQNLTQQTNQLELQISKCKNDVDAAFLRNQRIFLLAQIGTTENSLRTQFGQDNKSTTAIHVDESLGVNATLTSEKTNTLARQSPVVVDSSQPGQNPAIANTSSIETVEKFEKTNPIQDAGAVRSEPASKSRLSMAAAKAPPFQPRSQIKKPTFPRTQADMVFTDVDAITAIDGDALHEIEARLMASSQGWAQAVSATTTKPAHPNLIRANTVPENPSSTTPALNLTRSNTVHNPVVSSEQGLLKVPPQPYLIGTLPSGVNANLANPGDFVYSRALTEDEIRARYLYWGKAPRSALAGLPKFDGKDFYPPSPVKKFAQPAIDSPASNVNGALLSASSTPNLENLLLQSGVPSAIPGHRVNQSQDHVPKSDDEFGSISNQITYAGLGMTVAGYSENRVHNGELALPGSPLTRMLSHPGSPRPEDFSNLFMEQGVFDYEPPATRIPGILTAHKGIGKQEVYDELPVTPQTQNFAGSIDGGDNEIETHNSWEQLEGNGQNLVRYSTPSSPATTSTVEIRLTSQSRPLSPKSIHEKQFNERVESFRSVEQQTLFLQNLLKNDNQTTMVGSALSGAVSSATAQGYLPQYRGTAAASLMPTKLNYASAERDTEHLSTKTDTAKSAAMNATDSMYLPENQPFTQYQPRNDISSGKEALTAASLMRHLTQKDDNNKKLMEQQLYSTDNNGWSSMEPTGW